MKTATKFEIHDVTSAPAGSKDTLVEIKRNYGMVPHVVGVLAEAPAALAAYAGLQHAVGLADLTTGEQQFVQLVAAVRNGCEYCVAVHSTVGARMGTPSDAIDRVRAGQVVEDDPVRWSASPVRAWVVPRRLGSRQARRFSLDWSRVQSSVV